MIWWVVSWFIVGFICVAIMWLYDMRREPFDKYYFSSGTIYCSILTIVLGYASVIVLLSYVTSEKRYFTRFVYWVANIGVKNKD